MRNAGAAAVALIGLVATLSCADDTVGLGEPVPTSMVVVSGTAQLGTVGVELAQPLVVEVRDASNAPMPEVLVNFVVVSGGGAVFAGAVETDGAGQARDFWTLGTSTADSQRVEVRSVSSSGQKQVHAVFTATAQPGAVAAVNVTLDSTRLNFVGDTTTVPAQAFDAYGNRVPGAPIRWQVVGPAGVVAIDSMTGLATAQAYGNRRIRARVGALLDSARVNVELIAANIDPVKDTLAVNFLQATLLPRIAAFDSAGVRIQRIVPVIWQSLDTAIVTVTDTTTGAAVSRAPGLGRIEARAPGSNARDTVYARVLQVPATVEVSPPVSVLAYGDSLQLGAIARDSAGYALVTPAPIVWISLDTTRVRVSSVGRAYGVGYGAASVRARLPGLPINAHVALTVRNADTLAIAITGSAAQAGIVARPLADPLRVVVRNQFGEPQPGVAVAWWTADGAQLSSAATITDSLGATQIVATMDSVASIKRVYATIGGDTAAFSVVARPDIPAAFDRLSPAAQTDTVGDTVPALPRVAVRDRYGNGVPDVAVRFQARAGSVAGGVAQLTNADGIATVGAWRLDTIPGVDTMLATVQDTLNAAFRRIVFTSIVVPDSASIVRSLLSIADTVRERDSVVVTVQLRDRYDNPLTAADGQVTFGASFGVFAPTVDSGDGSYRAVFRPFSARATSRVVALLDGDTIVDSDTIISRSYQLRWQGGTAEYASAGNWSAPGGPPSTLDSLYIPANLTVYPQLVQNTTIENVLLESGTATINIGPFDLTVTRSFETTSTIGTNGITGTVGRLIMTGIGNLNGDMRALRVTDTGRVSATGNINVTSGRIVVTGGRLRSAGYRVRVRPN